MSSANEIVALKSLGISPSNVTRPAITFALVLSLVTVWLVDLAFSWGYYGMEGVILTSMDEVAYGVLRTQRKYSNDQFSISVADVDGKKLIRPVITFHQDDGEAITMMAREAQLRTTADGNLQVALTNGSVEVDDAAFHFPDTVEHVIPLSRQHSDLLAEISPSHMRLSQVPQARREQRVQMARCEQAMAVEAAFALSTGEFGSLSVPCWNPRLDKLKQHEQRLHRLETEPYRRWASGFSCLAFAIVGIPMAIRLRTADVTTTFGICFVPILLVYYPLFALGLDRAKNGEWPAYCVWLGNCACFAVGAWLIHRIAER
jgi:lipopolysaccharide export system permease protein